MLGRTDKHQILLQTPQRLTLFVLHSRKYFFIRRGYTQMAAARFIKAGTYHPATSTPSFVEANRFSITKPSAEARLAAITCVQPPIFTATHMFPLTASCPFTKSGSTCCTLFHRHHVQGDILKMLMQIIRNSQNPEHLFRVISHAGIAGNECADAGQVSGNTSRCKSCRHRYAVRWH